MKKLLLMPLFLVFFLVSCNDDEEEPIPAPVSQVDAQLRGKWTNTEVIRQYFSDTDTLMYADTSNIEAFFEFDGKRMKISLPGESNQEVWNYSFPDKDNENYIQFTKDGTTTDYLIKSISNTEMKWEDEEEYAGFPIDAEEKTTSRKGVYTYKFTRQQ